MKRDQNIFVEIIERVSKAEQENMNLKFENSQLKNEISKLNKFIAKVNSEKSEIKFNDR